MSAPFTFVLGLHDHQPVGNFDAVFAQAYAAAYLPFLDVLEGRPRIPVSLHHSGPLLEWLEAHEPGYLDRLRALAAGGRIEILGGAFYEPILPAIPHRDRVGQIALQRDWSERRLGQRPQGAWIAERVWEPGLVASLAEAGVDFTAVDDQHFRAAGAPEALLSGYALTEDEGRQVAVFPIDQRLRYLVPFEEPAAAVDYLRACALARPGGLKVLADDGEKFGLWPGTHATCYDRHWLARFFDALEGAMDQGWLRLLTLGGARAALPPTGIAYLPATSYQEMTEWALPTAAQGRLHALRERLARDPEAAGAHDFVRGGFWRNFLVKYPEANAIHKRMLRLSAAVKTLEAGEAKQRARASLYRSQCNCAYWHGVFGGLYLPHLRNALYRALIEGEAAVDRARGGGVTAEAADWDADGSLEVRLAGRHLVAWFAAGRGGALFGLDDRESRFNYLDVLSRRPEPYHARITEAAAARPEAAGAEDGQAGSGAKSIHEGLRVRGGGPLPIPAFDPALRGGLIEHLLDPAASLEDFAAGRAVGDGALVSIPAAATWSATAGEARAEFRREVPGPGGTAIRIEKRVALKSDAAGDVLEVEWTLSQGARGSVEFLWAVEFTATLLAGEGPERTVRVDAPDAAGASDDAGALARHEACRGFRLEDRWQERVLDVVFDAPAGLWRAPLKTVSLSEEGLETVYQGTVFLAREIVRLDPGARFTRRWRLESRALGVAPHARLSFAAGASVAAGGVSAG